MSEIVLEKVTKRFIRPLLPVATLYGGALIIDAVVNPG